MPMPVNLKQETKEAVTFYMSSRYGLTESDWGDAFDANWTAGETAEEWVEWYGEKHDLTPRDPVIEF